MVLWKLEVKGSQERQHVSRSLRFSIFVGCFYCVTALAASSVTADQLLTQPVEIKKENLIEPVEDFIGQTVDEPKVMSEKEPEDTPSVVEPLVKEVKESPQVVVDPPPKEMKESPQVAVDPPPKEIEKPPQKTVKVDDGRIEVSFKVSYYTSLACENTKYGAVDALGNPLVYGTIAVPKDVPLKSKFVVNGEEFVARDRGSKIKWIDSNTMKIDMFIPRNKGESDNAYYKRVNNMGIQDAKGYYIPYKKQ